MSIEHVVIGVLALMLFFLFAILYDMGVSSRAVIQRLDEIKDEAEKIKQVAVSAQRIIDAKDEQLRESKKIQDELGFMAEIRERARNEKRGE